MGKAHTKIADAPTVREIAWSSPSRAPQAIHPRPHRIVRLPGPQISGSPIMADTRDEHALEVYELSAARDPISGLRRLLVSLVTIMVSGVLFFSYLVLSGPDAGKPGLSGFLHHAVS